MDKLTAGHIIREWSLPRLRGLAICDDTPRFNVWVQMIGQMGSRVEQGGDSDKLKADLLYVILHDAPLQLSPHETSVKRLNEGFDELWDLLTSREKSDKSEAISTKHETEH